MIDLDSAEGLGPSTRRQPLLIAIVIDHHSGPSLANTRLTGRESKTDLEHSDNQTSRFADELYKHTTSYL